mmetsp:Transcript_49550/g.165430  ORF Transcript_49550/g.165430 Transcript_49550/m.165430 type:complete len:80 (-) Transcript_49550:688-927(-)
MYMYMCMSMYENVQTTRSVSAEIAHFPLQHGSHARLLHLRTWRRRRRVFRRRRRRFTVGWSWRAGLRGSGGGLLASTFL